jgi:hypothetical protein
VCGRHPHLGHDEVVAAARRLADTESARGTVPVTLDEVVAAVDAVAGPQGGRHGEIDPARTLAAAARAGQQLAAATRAGGRIALATAAPPSLLSLYAALARAARTAGGVVADPETSGPYASGRSLWWLDGVAVATDGRALVNESRPEAADEWLFASGRPAIAVADGVFAVGAIAAGVPTVAFADLDAPGPALAAQQGRPVVVVPLALRRPPGAYEPITAALVEAVTGAGPVVHDRDATRQPPHLATETPGTYAGPPSGGEG